MQGQVGASAPLKYYSAPPSESTFLRALLETWAPGIYPGYPPPPTPIDVLPVWFLLITLEDQDKFDQLWMATNPRLLDAPVVIGTKVSACIFVQ